MKDLAHELARAIKRGVGKMNATHPESRSGTVITNYDNGRFKIDIPGECVLDNVPTNNPRLKDKLIGETSPGARDGSTVTVVFDGRSWGKGMILDFSRATSNPPSGEVFQGWRLPGYSGARNRLTDYLLPTLANDLEFGLDIVQGLSDLTYSLLVDNKTGDWTVQTAAGGFVYQRDGTAVNTLEDPPGAGYADVEDGCWYGATGRHLYKIDLVTGETLWTADFGEWISNADEIGGMGQAITPGVPVLTVADFFFHPAMAMSDVVVTTVEGRKLVIAAHGETVLAYDAKTGEALWADFRIKDSEYLSQGGEPNPRTPGKNGLKYEKVYRWVPLAKGQQVQINTRNTDTEDETRYWSEHRDRFNCRLLCDDATGTLFIVFSAGYQTNNDGFIQDPTNYPVTVLGDGGVYQDMVSQVYWDPPPPNTTQTVAPWDYLMTVWPMGRFGSFYGNVAWLDATSLTNHNFESTTIRVSLIDARTGVLRKEVPVASDVKPEIISGWMLVNGRATFTVTGSRPRNLRPEVLLDIRNELADPYDGRGKLWGWRIDRYTYLLSVGPNGSVGGSPLEYDSDMILMRNSTWRDTNPEPRDDSKATVQFLAALEDCIIGWIPQQPELVSTYITVGSEAAPVYWSIDGEPPTGTYDIAAEIPGVKTRLEKECEVVCLNTNGNFLYRDKMPMVSSVSLLGGNNQWRIKAASTGWFQSGRTRFRGALVIRQETQGREINPVNGYIIDPKCEVAVYDTSGRRTEWKPLWYSFGGGELVLLDNEAYYRDLDGVLRKIGGPAT